MPAMQARSSGMCVLQRKTSGKKVQLELAKSAVHAETVPALPSPSVWRSQMFSIFIEAYFPTLRGGVTPSGWLLKFPNTQDSSTLFPLALDVLCLSHLGKMDPQMRKPAFSAYAKMVATLRRSLQLSDQKFSAIDHRMVAASMIALALLDAPDKSTQADWVMHWDAAYRFASARGPSYFDIKDPLTEALLRELFQGSLFLSLARHSDIRCNFIARAVFEWKVKGFATQNGTIEVADASEDSDSQVAMLHHVSISSLSRFALRHLATFDYPSHFPAAHPPCRRAQHDDSYPDVDLCEDAVNAQQCQVQGSTNCTASQVQSITNTIKSYNASTTFNVPVNNTYYVAANEDCKLAIDNYDENSGATISIGAVRGSVDDIVKSCSSNKHDFSGLVDLYGVPITVE
ncbi:hypothetical protein PRZ48_012811 [Zasmidium cellare]|uniref:Cyclin N-terminal domain-containing protein n=1 Tax=Zasmidium cellare TaxID=395010 RepID=A0ABR0E5X7_ZASCE|nr:hypothetical protein PRZ48_012811 [Zasmidium cellare]